MMREGQEKGPKRREKKASFKLHVHFLVGLSNCVVNVTFQMVYKEFTIIDRSTNRSLNGSFISAA